jgi:hypothetical protein
MNRLTLFWTADQVLAHVDATSKKEKAFKEAGWCRSRIPWPEPCAGHGQSLPVSAWVDWFGSWRVAIPHGRIGGLKALMAVNYYTN